MTTFILRRLLWSLPVLFVVVTILFFMMRAIGGDPFRHGPLFGLSNVAWVKYGDYQPPSIKSNLERRYGLDLPWHEQYVNYVEGVFTLRLGPSLSFRNRTVNELVAEHAPPSLELGLLAFGWALLLGIPLGILAAIRPNSPLDYAIRVATSFGIALPNFLVASLLVYYLAVKVGWFPTNGWSTWRHKVLPSFTLGLLPTAYFARLIRGGLLDALAQDYVAVARAKGLRVRRIVLVHGLRNALIPAVTVAGPMVGYLVTGAFVIETIFSVPGMARFFIASVLARDYPVIGGLTLLLAVLVILANLAVDLAYAVLDPRIRDGSRA